MSLIGLERHDGCALRLMYSSTSTVQVRYSRAFDGFHYPAVGGLGETCGQMSSFWGEAET